MQIMYSETFQVSLWKQFDLFAPFNVCDASIKENYIIIIIVLYYSSA